MYRTSWVHHKCFLPHLVLKDNITCTMKYYQFLFWSLKIHLILNVIKHSTYFYFRRREHVSWRVFCPVNTCLTELKCGMWDDMNVDLQSFFTETNSSSFKQFLVCEKKWKWKWHKSPVHGVSDAELHITDLQRFTNCRYADNRKEVYLYRQARIFYPHRIIVYSTVSSFHSPGQKRSQNSP